jgi:AcrR family transcriptional regulator
MQKRSNAKERKPEILEKYYELVIQEGIERASIGKLAKRMNMHPSLIVHYFKTKENLILELVDLLIEKYEAPEFLQVNHIGDREQQFIALLDTVFSLAWSRTVDPGVHFGFYYLSFRNTAIKERFEKMFLRFRDYLIAELDEFKKDGIVKAVDSKMAADVIVTLMEGLEFHAKFLAGGEEFEEFANYAKNLILMMLKGQPFSSQTNALGNPESSSNNCASFCARRARD